MTPRGAVRSETRVVQGGQGCHTVPARSSPYSVPAPTCARAGGQWYGHSPSMASTELHSITVAEPPAAKELPRGDLISALPSVGRVTAPLHVEPEGGELAVAVAGGVFACGRRGNAVGKHLSYRRPASPFSWGLWRNQTQGYDREREPEPPGPERNTASEPAGSQSRQPPRSCPRHRRGYTPRERPMATTHYDNRSRKSG